MPVKNSSVLQAAWLEGTWDFQQRIPNPDIEGYAKSVEKLFDPLNADLLNEFSRLLNGLIGTFVDSKLFENPLRELKKPATDAIYGNAVRYVAVKYLQAHSFDFNDQTLLKVERPEFVEWFYSINQERRYEFNWTRVELRKAFAQDGTGFEDLLQATFTQVFSSDNYDEMNVMINCFAEAETRLPGGCFKVYNAEPTTQSDARNLLVKLRAYAGRVKFPSMLYNHIPVPVHENPNTMVLWVTPEVKASLDVNALAELFHLEKAEVQYKIIEIPQFPIPNVFAALTSEDFIYARDTYYGLEPPFYNPGNLSYKYYLHHQQMIGVNPAAICILFTSDENAATSVPTITMTTTGAAFDPATGEIPIGGTLKLNPQLQGTVTDNDAGIAVEPNAFTTTIVATRTTGEGESATTEAVDLNSATYIDRQNVLHLQKTGVAVGDVITVTGVSTYVNPSGATDTYTATFTATVIAAEAKGAKECAVSEKPYIEYTDENEEVTASE